MNENEIIDIIINSSFKELQKMIVNSDHISLVELPDILWCSSILHFYRFWKRDG